MYKTLIVPLLGVFFLLLSGVGEAQAQRRMQRIDREIQKTVFIPKGTWMAGGTISYSEHNESNLNFLVLKDIEGKGYDFSVSPYFGYFFRDNISNVFAKGAKADEAVAAGAEFVGAEELIPRIQNDGWFDYDVVVATPDMMGVVGRLGRVLGPKGLMPNPKAGTVTMDVTKAVKEIKAGKIEYRLDKTNIIHVPIGKASFTEEQLSDNFQTLIGAINKAKPATLKGQYLKSVTLAPTMGPGVKVNTLKLA